MNCDEFLFKRVAFYFHELSAYQIIQSVWLFLINIFVFFILFSVVCLSNLKFPLQLPQISKIHQIKTSNKQKISSNDSSNPGDSTQILVRTCSTLYKHWSSLAVDFCNKTLLRICLEPYGVNFDAFNLLFCIHFLHVEFMCWLWRRLRVCAMIPTLSFHEEFFKWRRLSPSSFRWTWKDEEHAFLSCTPTSQFKWIPSAHSHSPLLRFFRFFSFFSRHELLYPKWKHRRCLQVTNFSRDFALFKVV